MAEWGRSGMSAKNGIPVEVICAVVRALGALGCITSLFTLRLERIEVDRYWVQWSDHSCKYANGVWDSVRNTFVD